MMVEAMFIGGLIAFVFWRRLSSIIMDLMITVFCETKTSGFQAVECSRAVYS